MALWKQHSIKMYWFILAMVVGGTNEANQSQIGPKALKVGEELKRQQLPLQFGKAIYDLQGLEPFKWYEVKISHPASIPARFSITILQEHSAAHGRRLLDTEKEMFYTGDNSLNKKFQGPVKATAIVTVRGIGVVSKMRKEQEHVLFNILCERSIFGIPQQALWVGFLAAIAVLIALALAIYMPPPMLFKLGNPTMCRKVNNSD